MEKCWKLMKSQIFVTGKKGDQLQSGFSRLKNVEFPNKKALFHIYDNFSERSV